MAVARHLLEIIWHMLKNNEEYRTQNEELSKKKFKALERIATTS